ncbi:hypothetical protein JZO70_11755 [Enterococcus sp. 669A]|uniref:Uncharacterized protein n=1 Tax=Candidatus Enterococcus moelleringii TaxID=2815325 RepID=A0ABS3LB38_9ENTE|nr:hypothetical protein [Enterococcus sp. 669A]MBO1306842.1 hypothetical protein [Enterococcus sp. 669A]
MYNSINRNTYKIILGIFTDTKDFRDSAGETFNIIFNGKNNPANQELLDGLRDHSLML